MNIFEVLKDHQVKPSVQRVHIYTYLVEKKSHPTVDEIYQNLHPLLITLSKTTVYNTLQLFVEKKLAIEILIEGNEVRYDADVSHHGHFKCHECQTIFDFDVKELDTNSFIPEGFESSDFHFYIGGLCDKCRAKKTIE